MFDELTKYDLQGHFFLKPEGNLMQVCEAPTDKSGIYIVYALKNGKIDLKYIGRSGKIQADGKIFIRKSGLGGIKDSIVNGYQFGKIPRRKSWLDQIKKEGIEALDVYWYVTHNQKFSDCPRIIEKTLLQKYFEIFGELPKWNKV